jgi:3'-5' exoribonuclease
VGKVRELGLGMGIPDYTDEGRLLGHIVIGALMVDERLRTIPDFPGSLRSELLHILVSHHGEHVWGSPKRPKTLEALIVHRVEDLDAKLSAFQQYLAQSRDPVRPHWTSYHKVFERFLFRGDTEEEVQEVRDEP